MTMSKPIEQIFHDINKFTTLNDTERRETSHNFDRVRDYILGKMQKEDLEFNRLSRGHNLAGSVADNIKISLPNEFDLLIYIKLRFEDDVIVTPDKKKPGNVKINVKQSLKKLETNPQDALLLKKLRGMVDDAGFLLQQKVQSWIQGILVKIQLHGDKFYAGTRKFELSYTTSGPAHTCHVKTTPCNFDVDLVPAIKFKTDKWRGRRPCPKGFDGHWDAIPKPLCLATAEERKQNISWQGSYANAERQLIARRNNLKNSLRILKKFKERQNYGTFKSYFLKTIFLWENERQDEKFWDQSLATLVLYMMEKWIDYLKNENLPFYWDDRCNLLSKQSFKTMADQLQAEYTKIQRFKIENTDKILSIFLTEHELKMLESNLVSVTEGFAETSTSKENSTWYLLDVMSKFFGWMGFR